MEEQNKKPRLLWKWVCKISSTVSSVIGYIVVILMFFRIIIFPFFIAPNLITGIEYASGFHVPMTHVDEITPDIDTRIKDFYNNKLDSLENEGYLFALGVFQGEIRYFPAYDSLGVVLQFNLDCGCPVEDSIMTCLLMPLDMKQLEIIRELYVDHVPKRTCPSITEEEGNK